MSFRLFCLCFCTLGATCLAPAGLGADGPLSASRQLMIPSFQMRTVSGPEMNRSICHVCRYGDRPVVMVVLRDSGPEQRILLRNLDRHLNSHRETGLRGFCVVLSQEPFRAISRVQTFAFNGRVEMPVGVTPETVADSSLLNVPEEVRTAVFLYENRQLQQRFDFDAAGPSYAEIRQIIAALEKMIPQDSGEASGISGDVIAD